MLDDLETTSVDSSPPTLPRSVPRPVMRSGVTPKARTNPRLGALVHGARPTPPRPRAQLKLVPPPLPSQPQIHESMSESMPDSMDDCEEVIEAIDDDAIEEISEPPTVPEPRVSQGPEMPKEDAPVATVAPVAPITPAATVMVLTRLRPGRVFTHAALLFAGWTLRAAYAAAKTFVAGVKASARADWAKALERAVHTSVTGAGVTDP
jgi:hypothetical protein